MDIDFIIPWVDGADKTWINEFNKYAPLDNKMTDTRAERYRDNGLLRYWFRGVAKFAPWVRKIHFITDGQKPLWLNTDNPKLNWVKHSDYIPAQHLPVFSSHPIEIYMHKIDGLSEHFVYFNDDFFLTNSIKQDFFFQKGKPCDCAILKPLFPDGNQMTFIRANNIACINAHFTVNVYIKLFNVFFSHRYGLGLIKNAAMLPWSKFSGFNDPHTAQPFTKSLFEEVWNKCSKELEDTMHSRFRAATDVNQWLFRYWNICSGNIHPINPHKGKKYFETGGNVNKICDAIEKQKYQEIIINDTNTASYDSTIREIINSFERILPEKSSFER